MRIIKKFIVVLILVIVSVGLVSCQQSMSMPRVQGKRTEFTASELEAKVEDLDFYSKDEGILKRYTHTKVKTKDSKESRRYDLSTIYHYNLANDESWVDYNYKLQENKGIIEGKITGFEGTTSSYFDIHQKNNGKFDEGFAYDREVYNGKYKINNNMSYILDYYGWNSVGAYNYGMPYFFPKFVKSLHEYNFKGLKLYEDTNFFSVEIFINKDILTNAQQDIIDLIANYIIRDIEEHIEFEYKIVAVFERNKLEGFGIHILIGAETEANGVIQKYEYSSMLIQKYVDRAPREVKYSRYESIESLEEIEK